jgi:hypothetical protein
MVNIPKFYKCKHVRLYSKTKTNWGIQNKKQKKSEEEWYDPLSPKNKVINKQNAKHVYTKQQIHSPNFTLVRANGHLNYVQKPAKKFPSSS